MTRRGETGYTIQPMRGGRRKVVHYNRLKPCYQRASKEISETIKSPADVSNNNQEDSTAQTRLQAVPPPLHTKTTLEQGRSYSKETEQLADVEATSEPTHNPPEELVPNYHLTNSNFTRIAMYVKPRTDCLKTPWT